METSQSLKEIHAVNFDCSIHTLAANSTLYLKKEEAKSCRRFSALEMGMGMGMESARYRAELLMTRLFSEDAVI